ncbi:MAG: hypothetical protein QN141_05600 [Armatimonadota bacterium]|nr:hypothetical protein [Armatimonadota bacterium]MDR7452686.1 hypothetical protein [Armatimonadota bacterium]MDR7466708.1 hypothetical protein [Armatimonadota bacterium]MDR7492818.1 hypothetical protein [Armatimonadota bacterium]MDR7498594.1 hypothetical protein [Armatimonadota bacterium]
MSTVWRCPQCGSVVEVEPRFGDEVVAVYDLCGARDTPRGARLPVRMERVEDPAEIVRLTAPQPALAAR